MSGSMSMDIRLPMGLMFAILGVILVVFGMISPSQTNAPSLGINVNLWWGLVILAFGALMLLLARNKRRADAQTKDTR